MLCDDLGCGEGMEVGGNGSGREAPEGGDIYRSYGCVAKTKTTL